MDQYQFNQSSVYLQYDYYDNWSLKSNMLFSGDNSPYISVGTNWVYLQAEDEAGNITIKTAAAIIDYSSPLLRITYPSRGLVTNNSVQLKWEVSDDYTGIGDIIVSGFSNNGLYDHDGIYNIVLKAEDLDGNVSFATALFFIDKTPPLTVDNYSNNDTWINYNPEIMLFAYDPLINNFNTGLSNTCFIVSGAANYSGTGLNIGTITNQGISTVKYFSIDRIGNIEQTNFIIVKVDKSRPVFIITYPLFSAITNNNVQLQWIASDNFTPMDEIIISGCVNNCCYTNDGEYIISLTAQDKAGNTGSDAVLFYIDKTPPMISDDYVPDGQWTGQDAVIRLASQDPLKNGFASGIESVSYLVQGAGNQSGYYLTNITITAEGESTVQYYCFDRAGNRSDTGSISVKIDRTAPVIQVSGVRDGKIYNEKVYPVVTISEQHIGPQVIELNDLAFVSGTVVSNEGTNRLHVLISDLAGNTAQSNMWFVIDRHTPPSKVTGVQALVDGRNVTLTWNYNPEGDIAGYRVYRDSVLRNTVLIASNSYIDPNLSYRSYVYRVSAVDTTGLEGALSDPVTVNIANPVFGITITQPQNRTWPATNFSRGYPAIRVTYTVLTPLVDFDQIVHEYGAGDAPAEWLPAPGELTGTILRRYYWNISGLASGVYTFRVRGITNSVTAAMDKVIVYLGRNIDLDPPVTVLSAGKNMVHNTNCYNAQGFSFSVTDPVVTGIYSSGIKWTRYRLNYINDWTFWTNGYERPADGAYTIEYQSEDMAGNRENANVRNILIDSLVPQTVISRPVEGEVIEGLYNIYGNVQDAHLISGRLEYGLGTEPSSWTALAQNISGDFTGSFDTTVLANGNYTLRLKAMDIVSNYSQVVRHISVLNTGPVVITNNPPSASAGLLVNSLDNGCFRGEDLHFTWSFIDVDTNDTQSAYQIIISKDSTEINTGKISNTVSEYTGSITEEGRYYWKVKCWDNYGAGGEWTDNSHSFFIDRSAPVIMVAGIADGGFYGSSVMITINISDMNEDLSKRHILLDGIEQGILIPVTDMGIHTLIVRAEDKAGNRNAITNTFTIDKTEPIILITGVEDNVCYDVPELDITVEIFDNNLAESGMTLNGIAFNTNVTASQENDYTLTAWARDVFGHTTTRTLHFSIDRSAPGILVSGIEAGMIYDHPVSVMVTITEPHLLNSQVLLDGSAYSNGRIINQDGTHTLSVSAEDMAGHVSQTNLSFIIDATPPVISVSGVEDGKAYRNDVSAVITVTEANPVTNYSLLNGLPYQSGTVISGEGQYELSVYARDIAGNVAQTNISFIIDKTRPQILVSGVDQGGVYNQYRSADIQIIELNLLDSYALLNGEQYQSGRIITNDNLYNLSVYAEDKAGNVSQTNISFLIDTTPPRIIVTGVSNNAAYSTGVAASVQIIEPNSRTNYVLLNGGKYTNGAVISAEGSYNLYVFAEDIAGNSAEVFLEFMIDKTPPVIQITGVEHNKYYNHDVTPVITVTDLNLTMTNISLDSAPFTSGTTLSAEKDYNLRVEAGDKAGNISLTVINFGIDKTLPLIYVSGVAEGGVYQEASAVINIVELHPDAGQTTITLNSNAYVSGTLISQIGDYTLSIHAVDLAGNYNDSAIRFRIERMALTNTLLFAASYDIRGDADFAVGRSNVLE
ncbi:MAG: Ig-like domain repeat protein, partial [bacterium]|nr:Ig-like domain repeat protein [bacterium]